MLDWSRPYNHLGDMGRTVKKITANTPIKILEQAQATTGLGITETLIAGLEELERSRNRSVLRMLRGKIRLDIDLDKTRR